MPLVIFRNRIWQGDTSGGLETDVTDALVRPDGTIGLHPLADLIESRLKHIPYGDVPFSLAMWLTRHFNISFPVEGGESHDDA